MGLFAGREYNSSERKTYLGIAGAWALAFGCSVGWGSFVMLLIAVNYHYLMNRHPDGGGTYTYTKKTYGYDHGFLSASNTFFKRRWDDIPHLFKPVEPAKTYEVMARLFTERAEKEVD